MKTNLTELKSEVLDNRLFYALALLKKARNIIHEEKSKKEMVLHYDDLDEIQDELNETSAKLNDVLSYYMSNKLDDAV